MTISKAHLSLFGLVMLMTGIVDGVSDLPSIAIFGPQLVFFFIIGCVLFLLPVSLIAAELCANHPDDSGVYGWSKKAFGGNFASVVIWLQWVNTMIYFPTCLTTFIGTLTYFINPHLAQNPVFLVVTSLSTFWIITALNLKGIQWSTKMASSGTTIGMFIPMIIVMLLIVLWFVTHKPLAIHMDLHSFIPNGLHNSSWASLTAIITAFLGMELATVHVKRIHNGATIFPKALLLTVVVIVFTMGLGSLGVSMIIPYKDISLVSGTVFAFHTLFSGFHLAWMAPIIAGLLVFGSLGAMVNWLISPAYGLAQAVKGHQQLAPFAKLNKHGVPYKIFLAQGIIVSITTSAFFLMPSINGSYWFLLDLSTELYVLMYFLIFIVAIKLIGNMTKTLIIPAGKKLALGLCACGLIGCIITLVVGFFPPKHINVGSSWHFIGMFTIALLTFIAPSYFLMKHTHKTLEPKAY